MLNLKDCCNKVALGLGFVSGQERGINRPYTLVTEGLHINCRNLIPWEAIHSFVTTVSYQVPRDLVTLTKCVKVECTDDRCGQDGVEPTVEGEEMFSDADFNNYKIECKSITIR